MMKKSKRTIIPAFKSAQQLFKGYSTLRTEDDIYQALENIMGQEIFDASPELTSREILNKIILRSYPNEAAIKAAFINQVLLTGKSHVTIFEFPVDTSRADLCKVNGCSAAFEIKTDLDSLHRLDRQLGDYSRIFEYVYLICSKERLDAIASGLPEEYGLYSYRFYNGRLLFSLERSPTRTTKLNPSMQLSLVTKEDLMRFSRSIGTVTKNQIIEELLQKRNPDDINRFFKRYLKEKYTFQWQFLKQHIDDILEIDYQWFFKNPINPDIIYQKKKAIG